MGGFITSAELEARPCAGAPPPSAMPVPGRQACLGGGGVGRGPPPHPTPFRGAVCLHSAAAGALALRRFGGLELGSGSFDFRHERWREMELSSWLDGDEVVVLVPVLLWDLAW